MKKHIALGVGLLLTLGTAVAGTLAFSGGADVDAVQAPLGEAFAVETQVSPEVMAMWKATAASADYLTPKAPI